MLRIRPVQRTDLEGWLRLRVALWPEGMLGEHRAEIEHFLDGAAAEPLAVLVAEEEGALIGLAELSLRPSAEGCQGSPVAYLEGWFVVPAARRRGIGRALIAAAEDWARARGCQELASDTTPANSASIGAHHAAGFEDAGTVLCFRKPL